MRDYRYVVDGNGRILHDGTEIIDPLVLRFFLNAMQRTPEGRYLVVCQNERNWFEAADTPFVVQRIRCRPAQGEPASIELHFAGDYHEPLEPESLEAEGTYLYCRVRRGAFRARFGRIAIQQLAPFLVEGDGEPALLLRGTRYAIKAAAEGRPASSIPNR